MFNLTRSFAMKLHMPQGKQTKSQDHDGIQLSIQPNILKIPASAKIGRITNSCNDSHKCKVTLTPRWSKEICRKLLPQM